MYEDSVNAYRDIVNAIRTAEKKKFAEGLGNIPPFTHILRGNNDAKLHILRVNNKSTIHILRGNHPSFYSF